LKSISTLKNVNLTGGTNVNYINEIWFKMTYTDQPAYVLYKQFYNYSLSHKS